jgi:sugar lactone lactonase YvrE
MISADFSELPRAPGGMQIVVDDGNLCGEGPLWDERAQALYWTDITSRRFYRYLWREGQRELIHEGFEVGGFCLQEGGGYLVTNSRGIWLWTPRGGEPLLLASEADGQECVMNDCIADPEGRVYSGSWHLDADGNAAPSFLFRVDSDGSVHVVDEGIAFSNGLAFSPDCRTLYFADTVARCIYSYDRRPEDGSLRNRRIFVKVGREEGLPDGLTVDAEGFLWCAHWFGGCLTRYDPEGRRERRVETPAAQTSSVAFGGPELDEIYVTSAALTNALTLAPPGYDPSNVFVGGPLYRFRAGIRGMAKFRSQVRPREPELLSRIKGV